MRQGAAPGLGAADPVLCAPGRGLPLTLLLHEGEALVGHTLHPASQSTSKA